MDYLFIAGCPRSGTTALLRLLNADERFALGAERFKKVTPSVADFAADRFLNPQMKETNILDAEHYAMIAPRLDSPKLRYVGDKTPGYYRRLGGLYKEFPEARFLFTYRDPVRVANSFENRAGRPSDGWSSEKDHEEGIRQWRDSLRKWKEFVDRRSGARLFPIKYEWFFCGDLRYLSALYRFLQVELTDEVLQNYLETAKKWNQVRKKNIRLTTAQAGKVESQVDRTLVQWADERCARAVFRGDRAGSLDQYPTAEAFRRFSRFVVTARDQQIAATLGNAVCSEETRTGGIENKLDELIKRSASLGNRLEAYESSLWWRTGNVLRRLTGRPAAGAGALSKGARRIESRCRQLRRRVRGRTV